MTPEKRREIIEASREVQKAVPLDVGREANAFAVAQLLSGAFVWDSQEGGSEYWAQVYNRLMRIAGHPV